MLVKLVHIVLEIIAMQRKHDAISFSKKLDHLCAPYEIRIGDMMFKLQEILGSEWLVELMGVGIKITDPCGPFETFLRKTQATFVQYITEPGTSQFIKLLYIRRLHPCGL